MTAVIKHAPYWEQGLPTHLPFRNANETMFAWELFEASELRIRLSDLEQRAFDGLVSEEATQRDFKTVLAEISRKSNAYTQSIGKSARRLGKPTPEGPVEIRKFVAGMAINDPVVCHAAMMQTYGWLMSAWAIALGESPDPTHRRQRMGMMVRGRAIALYDEITSIKSIALSDAGIPPDKHDCFIWQPFEAGGHLPGWSRMDAVPD